MLRSAIMLPTMEVPEPEFRRLLGYPRGASPSARADELAAWARAWFAEHGRPWIYLREVGVETVNDRLTIDGVVFPSPQLLRHLQENRATKAVLFAASAGAAVENRARELWGEGKPDEYFFLETYGSAVVERLTALVNAHICADAERRGLSAIPHYSPGYGGWDVAEQPALFAVINRQRAEPYPESLEVLSSGMLRPKKSLLGIIGLSAERVSSPDRAVPCERCSWSPCQYRRGSYRHGDVAESARSLVTNTTVNESRESAAPLTLGARYSIAPRALEKWSRERLQLEIHADGAISARFRFDGTTCSNMGRPLAFEYQIELGRPQTRYRVDRMACTPVAGEDGYQAMCEYLRDPEGLMTAIATESPLLGQPLDDVLTWQREHISTGCYCDAASRAHKWGMALEVLHYALARQNTTALVTESKPSTNQDPMLTTDRHG